MVPKEQHDAAIGELEGELGDIRAQLETKSKEAQELSAQLESSREEVHSLQMEVSGAKHSCMQAECEARDAKEGASGLQARIKDLEASAGAAGEEGARWREALESAERSHKAVLEATGKDKEAAEGAAAEADARAERLESDMKGLRDELSQLREQAEQSEASL